jgi:hypothetical protein
MYRCSCPTLKAIEVQQVEEISMNYGISVQRVEIISSPRLHLEINLDTNRIYSTDAHGVLFPQRARCNDTQSLVRKTQVVSPEARP